MSQRSLDENPGCLSTLFGGGKKKEKGVKEEIDYSQFCYLKSNLLSKAELNFYRLANEVLKGKYILCPQVSLQAIVFARVQKYGYYLGTRGKIQSKYIDFLVCDSATMKPVYAIELDDSSHEDEERRERDEFLDRVFDHAGLPLIHVDCKMAYSQSELTAILLGPLQNRSIYQNGNHTQLPPEAITEVEMNCQKCGAPMNIRKADAGSQIGREYWVCTNYPKCRNFFPVEKVK